MAYVVMLAFLLSSTARGSSAESWDSPSVMTIITFLAPRRPPRANASCLEHTHRDLHDPRPQPS